MLENKKNIKKYGLIGYTSMNIGDEIQSVAASRFLPKIDAIIQREKVNTFTSEYKHKLIMNAWWMWEPQNFVASSHIEPLMISMYIRDEIRDKLDENSFNYLRQNAPIGCRDYSTRDFLLSKGIDAYFSGCLTLTLNRNPSLLRDDYILAIDIPDEIVRFMRRNTNRPVYTLTQILSPSFSREGRFELSRIVLYLLSKAHCVITTRLHVALPCLALETPVLRLDLIQDNNNISSRFSGYEGFLHTTHENFGIKMFQNFDFENPPKNPDKYIEVRDSLIQKVKEFTGYDSKKYAYDFNNSTEALVKIMQNLSYNKKTINKTLWWSSNKVLLKTWFKKSILKQNRHQKEFF